jgi:type I site-specific restriction endonuclease
MNESETRAELIDPALQAAGWGVVEGSRIRLGIDAIDIEIGQNPSEMGKFHDAKDCVFTEILENMNLLDICQQRMLGSCR